MGGPVCKLGYGFWSRDRVKDERNHSRDYNEIISVKPNFRERR